jgi:hypothetical protein
MSKDMTMIARFRIALAASALLLLAGPALAESCGERADALERRLDQEGREAVSASTGGKDTGARREAKAEETERTGEAPSRPANAPQAAPGEKQAQAAAADAGGGGTGVMQAKASLNEARVALGKGDEPGCLAAMAKAEKELETPR